MDFFMWQYEVEGNGIVAVLDYSAPNARPALKLPEIPRESVVSLNADFGDGDQPFR